ncbi:MAG: LysR family transcriptional regulator [Candidatus Thiodiazotropha sp.]
MDIESARTFLVVSATGNFIGAADKLHITQSTVSNRIKTLEQQLGTTLFKRGRGGAVLTASGKRFLPHAKVLLRTYEQARHEVALSRGFSSELTLCGRIALWDGFLLDWSSWMRQRAPHVSLRLEIGFEEEIMQGLVQGLIDVGVMYTPQSRPHIAVEHLFGEPLILVTSSPDRYWRDTGYVHVDWGPEFQAQFAARFPALDTPAQRVNIGWLALQLLNDQGGSAYLPIRLVRRMLDEGLLFPVDDSPLITLPVYMAYPLDREEPDLTTALIGMRRLGKAEAERYVERS